MQAKTELKSEIAMAVTAAMETAINAYLKMDPDASGQFARFNDKVIAIELVDMGIKLFCLPSAQGISIMSQYQGEADTLISGRPLSMAKLALMNDTQVMFDGEVKISGDVELGQKFKKAIEDIDIDWEEHLSRATGDVIAHKTGQAIREMASWWRNNKTRAQANGREYLQQEVDVLPMCDEAETLYQNIETLRDDTARIEARIKQLAGKNKESE
ncbi:Protein YigP (COG3165) clustered with ubiquinone biosynthetic genes [hydrothermal vent metagenome]|uniref:Protein YigP (COG3165) clustered with ubiquinone biosynthetic genes n=1 Tax=hydrothermal vent metagenome TaxID=652676 RepID=A0A3B1A156_9ZZZZ